MNQKSIIRNLDNKHTVPILPETVLLDAVTENTETSLAYLDRDFNFVWVNSTYARACAKTREELIGCNHFDLFPHEENEAIFAQVRDTGEPFKIKEKPFIFPDHLEWGVTYWDWTLTPVKNVHGEVQGLVFSLVDVTERKRDEDELRRYHVIASRAADIFLFVSPDGRILDVNESAEHEYGYSREELLSMHIRDLRLSEDLPSLTAQLKQAANGLLFETVHKRKDGTVFPVEVNARGVALGDETVVASIIRNITDRKLAEESLQAAREELETMNEELFASNEELNEANTALQNEIADRQEAEEELVRKEQEFRALAENSPDVVVRFDKKLRHLYANPAAGKVLDIPVSAIIGKTNDELGMSRGFVYPWQKTLKKVFATGNEEACDFRLDTPTGTRYYDARMVPEFAEDGSVETVIAIARDVTEKTELDKKRQDLYERERHIAEVLQKALVPDAPEPIDGCDIAVVYEAALNEAEVGGDFYDVFDIGNGLIGVVIGDVVGKGLSAAIRVAAARHSIRSYAYTHPDPGKVMTLTNNALCRNAGHRISMLTAFFAVIDTVSGKVTYANGGHEPPWVRRADGSVEMLDICGRVLGVLEGYNYTSESIYIRPGDLFILTTDGITEARTSPSDLFGSEGVVEFLKSTKNETAHQLAAHLLKAAKKHAHNHLVDDAAVVVFGLAKGDSI